MEAFQDAKHETEYSQLLNQSMTIDPILDFLDKHMAQASDSVKDTLLRGLTGFIRDDASKYDLDALNRYYQMAGQDIHQALASCSSFYPFSFPLFTSFYRPCPAYPPKRCPPAGGIFFCIRGNDLPCSSVL